MSRYLQTSTDNPSGRRPWQTRLYTEFEDYGFLKQPQNKILREDLSMRPEIYKPPELKLGDATIVTGTGRVVQRGRRRRRVGLGILPAMLDRSGYTFPTSTMVRAIETPSPLTILPPPSPPAVPTVVAQTPAGTVYSLPGSVPAPNSPYAPPSIAPSDAAASPAPSVSSFSDWFNSATWIDGIPNGYVAIGIAGVIYLFAKKPRRF